MASSAFPSVIAAVRSVAQSALTQVRVIRGRDVSDDWSDVVMVGVQQVDQVDQVGWDSAGDFRQTMQTFGGNREEVGTVYGLITASDGGGDNDATCSTAFGYLADLEASVRADPTLGLTTFDYVVAELRAGDVAETQNAQGVATTVSFAIDYKIRI